MSALGFMVNNKDYKDYTELNFIPIQLVNHGNLLNDFSPAVNPPAEIEDVNDSKPEDWDEREKVCVYSFSEC